MRWLNYFFLSWRLFILYVFCFVTGGFLVFIEIELHAVHLFYYLRAIDYLLLYIWSYPFIFFIIIYIKVYVVYLTAEQMLRAQGIFYVIYRFAGTCIV